MLTTSTAPHVSIYFGRGGKLLDVLGLALGHLMDPAKAVDASVLVDVLGIEVDLCWARKLVSTCVSADKATKWTDALEDILHEAVCSPELASKMAGRLSFAVTATCDRVGEGLRETVLRASQPPDEGLGV